MTALPIVIGVSGFITGYMTSTYLNKHNDTTDKKKEYKKKEYKKLNIILSDDICGFSKITLKKKKKKTKKGKYIKKNLLDDLKQKLKERREKIIILD